jgi:hypothetical protein
MGETYPKHFSKELTIIFSGGVGVISELIVPVLLDSANSEVLRYVKIAG